MKTRFLFTYATAAILLGQVVSPLFAQDDDAGEREPIYWVAPMDPNYRRSEPGKSPMGMDLVPVYADEINMAGSVTIAPELMQNLGVRTAVARTNSLKRHVNTVGYVDYDESRLGHIHLRTSGWVENLQVQSLGDRVKQGDLLFDFYSPELVNAQEEYIQSLGSGNDRLVGASKSRLLALGVSAATAAQIEKSRQARQTVPVYAPQDGVVADLSVREGMYVQPSLRTLTLADLSSVWLLAEVFERQANWVRPGQTVDVRLAYLPGQVLQGRVEYIYPYLDPQTRTLKVRMQFDNPGELLKPNMYAQVRIYSGPSEEAIVIPTEALIRTGFEERVIIALGGGRFEARRVQSGIESGDSIQVLSGIGPGESVVTSAQFLIDSEASLNASVLRMTPLKNSQNGNQPDD